MRVLSGLIVMTCACTQIVYLPSHGGRDAGPSVTCQAPLSAMVTPNEPQLSIATGSASVVVTVCHADLINPQISYTIPDLPPFVTATFSPGQPLDNGRVTVESLTLHIVSANAPTPIDSPMTLTVSVGGNDLTLSTTLRVVP